MLRIARTRPASLLAVILVGGLATAHADEPVAPAEAPPAEAAPAEAP
ncbi:MAG: hypothetical protein H0T42_00690, partial [Deltaproteobacteria bacterium]|nr:hypothetical protein [Deltaproteobacteria bacterium]